MCASSLQAEAARTGRPGLTNAQATLMACLRPVDATDGVSVSDLARRLGVTRQVAHVTVHELVDAGILALHPDPTSGRSKLVRTTATGEARRQQAWRSLHQMEDELGERIGHDVLDALRAGLTATARGARSVRQNVGP